MFLVIITLCLGELHVTVGVFGRWFVKVLQGTLVEIEIRAFS